VRGIAHDPVLRAKLMAQHEAGIPLSVLSERHGMARPVLSRWWARYRAADLVGVRPRSRRPHRSPTRHAPVVADAIDAVRDFGWGVARIADELGVGHGTVQRALERSGRNQLPRAPRRPSIAMRRPGRVNCCISTSNTCRGWEIGRNLSMRRLMISAARRPR
jgi:lambda repressor-like predicted transcriptional regulator